jgi:hypothetical protein
MPPTPAQTSAASASSGFDGAADLHGSCTTSRAAPALVLLTTEPAPLLPPPEWAVRGEDGTGGGIRGSGLDA